VSTGHSPQEGDFTVTELEVRLRAPGGELVRDNIVARLDDLLRHVEEDMNSGLASAEFTCAKAIRKALSSARSVVVKFPAGGDRTESAGLPCGFGPRLEKE